MTAVGRPQGAGDAGDGDVVVGDPAWEAQELDRRCRLIEDPAAQGEPLLTRDYVVLALATILLPVLLVLIGSLT
jgi:hypothetical protein